MTEMETENETDTETEIKTETETETRTDTDSKSEMEMETETENETETETKTEIEREPDGFRCRYRNEYYGAIYWGTYECGRKATSQQGNIHYKICINLTNVFHHIVFFQTNGISR